MARITGTAYRSWPGLGLLVVAALLSAGCHTNFGAQTEQVYDPGAGVNDRSGGVYVLNALVVANPDSSGTLSVALLDKRTAPDQLSSVDAATADAQLVDVTQNIQPLPLCPERLTNLGPTAAVTLKGVTAGDVVAIGFTFSNASPVRLDVPVVSRGSDQTYAGVAKAPSASPSVPPCSAPPPSPTG